VSQQGVADSNLFPRVDPVNVIKGSPRSIGEAFQNLKKVLRISKYNKRSFRRKAYAKKDPDKVALSKDPFVHLENQKGISGNILLIQ